MERLEITRPNFSSFIVCKKNGELFFGDMHQCESRNTSTYNIIKQADFFFNFKDFDPVVINTSDTNVGKEYQGLRVLSYSTQNEDYSNVCPDFIFDSWPECQVDDYENTRKDMWYAGGVKAETDMLGWRGAFTHPFRRNLVAHDDKKDFDVEEIVWDRSNPNKLTCVNYVSLIDHVRKWRYLIDVEGHGYSARTKLFFFSHRVVFLQDRPHKEWYYPLMKPWVHYVPVKRDLSDLRDNLNRIKNDPELEKSISSNALKFALDNLTRYNAYVRWEALLNK